MASKTTVQTGLQVTVQRKAIHTGLQIASKAVTGRSPLPILNSMLLRTTDTGLKVVGNDLELCISCDVDAQVYAEGSVAVPSKTIAELLANLPENADVQLEMLTNENLQVKSGSSKHKLLALNGEDYPLLPTVEDGIQISIPQGVLKRMIESTLFAVAEDTTNNAIKGVLLHTEGNTVTMVATDTHRVVVCKHSFATEYESTSSILPPRSVAEIAKLLSTENGDVEITIGKSKVIFALPGEGNIEVVTVLNEGTYPHYARLFPADELLHNKATVDTDTLVKALRRTLIAARENSNRVVFTFANNKLTLTSESQIVGAGEELIDVEYSGYEGYTIGFNGNYITDFLKIANCKTVSIAMQEFTKKPAIVKPADEAMDVTYLVMPMEIL